MPSWAKIVSVIFLIYSLSMIATCILVKRGIMLGGVGRSAYFPGAIKENVNYEVERKILNSVNVKANEMPLDIAFWALIIGFNIFGVDYLSMFGWIYELEAKFICEEFLTFPKVNCVEEIKSELLQQFENSLKVQIPVMAIVWVMICGLALFRRIKVKRM